MRGATSRRKRWPWRRSSPASSAETKLRNTAMPSRSNSALALVKSTRGSRKRLMSAMEVPTSVGAKLVFALCVFRGGREGRTPGSPYAPAVLPPFKIARPRREAVFERDAERGELRLDVSQRVLDPHDVRAVRQQPRAHFHELPPVLDVKRRHAPVLAVLLR